MSERGSKLVDQGTNERYDALFIVGIAVVCRILALIALLRVDPLRPLTFMGYENVAIAVSIHAGHGYSSPFYVPSGPSALLAPGYPFLIASVIHFVGIGPVASLVLIAINEVLSLLTVLVVMKAAHQFFGPRVANFSGLICAITPGMWLAPLWIWETSLSALILVSAIAVAPRLTWRRSSSIAAGLGGALATLINPALLPSLIAISTWSALQVRRVPWWAIAAFLIALSPWPIRNAVKMHAFIPLRSSFTYELWIGNLPGATGELPRNQGPFSDPTEARLLMQAGELNYLRAKGSVALRSISSQPIAFARLTLKRFFLFWRGKSLPMTITAMIGLFLLWNQRRIFILFALPLLLYPLPYYITHADARYQFVLDPLLAILAGFACESFFAWCARRPMPAATLASSH